MRIVIKEPSDKPTSPNNTFVSRESSNEQHAAHPPTTTPTATQAPQTEAKPRTGTSAQPAPAVPRPVAGGSISYSRAQDYELAHQHRPRLRATTSATTASTTTARQHKPATRTIIKPPSPRNNSDDEYEYESHPAASRRARATRYPSDHTEEKFREDMLKRFGFEVVDVAKDGNCMFRAVSLQLFGDTEMHDDIRQMCMDYMEKERDHFSAFVTEDFSRYIQRKRRIGCFGNHLELTVMSELFNRPIVVYSVGAEVINVFNEVSSEVSIRLSYHRQNHYNAVIDINYAAVGVGLGLPNYNKHFETSLKHAKIQSDKALTEEALATHYRAMSEWEATDAEMLHAALGWSSRDWVTTTTTATTPLPTASGLASTTTTTTPPPTQSKHSPPSVAKQLGRLSSNVLLRSVRSHARASPPRLQQQPPPSSPPHANSTNNANSNSNSSNSNVPVCSASRVGKRSRCSPPRSSPPRSSPPRSSPPSPTVAPPTAFAPHPQHIQAQEHRQAPLPPSTATTPLKTAETATAEPTETSTTKPVEIESTVSAVSPVAPTSQACDAPLVSTASTTTTTTATTAQTPTPTTATASVSSSSAPTVIQTLMEMGFQELECVQALSVCGEDLNSMLVFLTEQSAFSP